MYQPVSLSIKDTFSFKNQVYEFVQGKPIIVVGENNDDPNQQRNGSGKSSFVECIAIAYLGSPVRNVSSKEIVRRGSKTSEIEHLLFNSADNKYLKIIRRTHSGSKAAECELYQHTSTTFKPEHRIVCSDINEYNKKVFELIGISKEDFLQFYILTAKYYKPFLLSSDTIKKEIVNRFSNAQIIDNVFPHIDEETNGIDKKFVKAKSQVDQLIGKKELYEQQLTEKKEKQQNISQEKADKKKAINEQIAQNKEQDDAATIEYVEIDTQLTIEVTEFEAQDWGQALTHLEDELADLEQNSKDQVKRINDETSKIDEKVDKKFLAEYTEYDESKAEFEQSAKDLRESIKTYRLSLNKYTKESATLSNSLHDSITCPKCTHIFQLGNDEFNKEQIEERIADLQQSIVDVESLIKEDEEALFEYQAALDEDLPNLKKELDAKVIKEKAVLMKALDQMHSELSEINENKRNKRSEITDLQNDHKAKEKEIEQLQKQLEAVKKRQTTLSETLKSLKDSLKAVDDLSYQDEIDELDNSILHTEMSINEQKTTVEQLEQEKKDNMLWNENFKQFKSYIANQSINNIEVYANLFLQQMNTDLSIVLSGYKVLPSSKQVREQISVTIQRNGVDIGSYGAFSGGERGRIDVAVILAIQQLINLNSTTGGLNLLIADEVLDNIEPLGLESIITSCEDLDKNILIVSQNEINALKKSTLTIRKQDKISTFVN